VQVAIARPLEENKEQGRNALRGPVKHKFFKMVDACELGSTLPQILLQSAPVYPIFLNFNYNFL